MIAHTLRSFVLLAIAGLSACMGTRPTLPLESRIQPPPTWRDGTKQTASTAIDSLWWRELGDATLDTLVERALHDNDDLRIAAARVMEARATLAFSRAALLPHVDAKAKGARDAGISPFGLADHETQGTFGATIAYEADIFGRLRSEAAAASARLSESRGTHDALRLSVAAAAAASYIELRALDARLGIAESTLVLREDSLHVAKRRYARGYSSALDLKQAESEYLATQRLIPELRDAIAKQENAISILLGDTPGAIPRGATLSKLTIPTLPRSLPSAVISQRPDVYAAEQDLIAADRSLSTARAAFLPNITLEAGVARAFSTLYPEPISLWSIGGSILAPIFEGGALRAQQDLAAARREQAAFAYRRTVLIAFREVEDQMSAIESTGEQIEILVAQEGALASASQFASRRYRTGYSSYLEQLDSERGLLDVQLAVVQMRANQLLAYVDLFRAMGGGWHRPGGSADMQAATGSFK
jgi:multidrug efflux system outer membrane protein